MSDSSEPKSPLDLSDLRLMPKWVADFGKTAPSTGADHGEDDTDRRERRGPRDGRDQRRSFGGGAGGGRGDGPPRGERRSFDRPRGPSDGNRGPRPAGDRRDDRRGGGGGGNGPRFDRDRDRNRQGGQGYGRGGRDDRGGRPPFEQHAPAFVQGLVVQVEPEAKATEAMASMIRTAGKAYSVFDAARLVLASGERFHVKFKLGPEVTAKLYAVPTDGSLWLGKEDALAHVLHGEALDQYYKGEDVEMEEPKGNFTSVAICGMSGELLGPPSHHSYQTTLHKIHRERFSHLPFEDYKRRVRTDNTPEAVAKWKESQKHGRQWTWLKGEEGAEPKVFKSRGEVEAHFRAQHADTLVGEVTEATVSGGIPKRLLAPALYNHLRRAVDDARKHLLGTAQQLCSGFERHGLKLFKRRGGKLWVSRTRPRLLDSSVVLSDRIAKMVEIIKTQPGLTVKKLVEEVAPSAEEASTKDAAASAPESAPAPLAEVAPLPWPDITARAKTEDSTTTAASETTDPEAPATEESSAESEAEAPVENTADEIAATSEQPAPVPDPTPAAPAPQAAAQHQWSGEQLHVLQDLHWLNSEGYVIEYADGVVFPGVTEPPPPKPKASPAAKQQETPAPVSETSEEATADSEAAEVTSDDAPAGETSSAEEPVTGDGKAESVSEVPAEAETEVASTTTVEDSEPPVEEAPAASESESEPEDAAPEEKPGQSV